MSDKAIDKLEEMVMLALVRLGSNAYGVTIQQEISDRAGRDVSFATIYKVLDRLERKGFVSSRLGERTPERGGRAKRFYRVEAPGVRALNADREAMDNLWAGVALPNAV